MPKSSLDLALVVTALCLAVVIAVVGAVVPVGSGVRWRCGGGAASGCNGTSAANYATGTAALQSLASPEGSLIVPSSAAGPDTGVEIAARIDGKSPVAIRLSSTFAGLYVPGRVGSRVSLSLSTAVLEAPCSTLHLLYTGTCVLIGTGIVVQPAPSGLPDDVPILGLGPAMIPGTTKYQSPVLAALQTAKLRLAWALNLDAARGGLSFRVPAAPCFAWCWTPMSVSSSGEYEVALLPGPGTPWTSAILDVGTWTTGCPGVGASDVAQGFTLRTASCEFTVKAGDASALPGTVANPVRLGVAAIQSSNIVCVDLERGLLGITIDPAGAPESTLLTAPLT
jgi:hypothetical protein